MTLNRYTSKLPLSAQEIRQAIQNTIQPVINRSNQIQKAIMNSQKENASGTAGIIQNQTAPFKGQIKYGTNK